MIKNNEIHLRVKQLRIKNNLTQKDFSEKINVSQANYSSFETGKSNLNIETFIKISEFFDVSLDYLFKGIEKSIDNSNGISKEKINYDPLNFLHDQLKEKDNIIRNLTEAVRNFLMRKWNKLLWKVFPFTFTYAPGSRNV